MWIEHIKDDYEQWPHWTLLIDQYSNDIAAFSAVQSHNFPENVVRVLSRYIISPKYRRGFSERGYRYIRKNTQPSNRFYQIYGPRYSVLMFADQIKYIKANLDPSYIIFSKESHRRRWLMDNISKEINTSFDTDFKVLDGFYKTYPGAPTDKGQWQIIAAHQLKDDILSMEHLSEQDFKRQFA